MLKIKSHYAKKTASGKDPYRKSDHYADISGHSIHTINQDSSMHKIHNNKDQVNKINLVNILKQ